MSQSRHIAAILGALTLSCGGATPSAKLEDASGGSGAGSAGTSGAGGSAVAGTGGSSAGTSGAGMATGGSSSGTGGSSGSSAGTGSASGTGGSGGNQEPPPHMVRACDSLEPVGVWEDITPPGVNLDGFGVPVIAVDPSDTSIIYVGTDKSGIHKSTDCGATWVHIDTGTLGAELDTGTIWVVIDPIEPNVLYANSLYGINGFFKSTNGGVDWTQVLSEEVRMYAPYGGFVGGIAIDPDDHLHVLVSWHQVCGAPYTSACYAQTRDGGATWVMRDGDPSWQGGEGAFLDMLGGNVWLFSSASNGLWRSTDQGESWAKIPDVQVAHAGGQLYRSPNGDVFLGSGNGVLHSEDAGLTWTLLPGSGSLVSGVAGDGRNIWSSSSYPYNPGDRPGPHAPFMRATEGDPRSWSSFDSPEMTSGANRMFYDPDHKLLYTANWWEGVKRVVVE
jgi:hypothetical protein